MAIRSRYRRWLAGGLLVIVATIFFLFVLISALYGYTLMGSAGLLLRHEAQLGDMLRWLSAMIVCPMLMIMGFKAFYKWLCAFVRDVGDSIEK